MCVLLVGEEKRKAEAGRQFIAKMKNPSFVADMVGANQPPCFCCLHNVEETCPHVVGELDCTDYVLYSESSEKVERKLFLQITAVHLETLRLKGPRLLKNAA